MLIRRPDIIRNARQRANRWSATTFEGRDAGMSNAAELLELPEFYNVEPIPARTPPELVRPFPHLLGARPNAKRHSYIKQIREGPQVFLAERCFMRLNPVRLRRSNKTVKSGMLRCVRLGVTEQPRATSPSGHLTERSFQAWQGGDRR